MDTSGQPADVSLAGGDRGSQTAGCPALDTSILAAQNAIESMPQISPRQRKKALGHLRYVAKMRKTLALLREYEEMIPDHWDALVEILKEAGHFHHRRRNCDVLCLLQRIWRRRHYFDSERALIEDFLGQQHVHKFPK